MQEMRDIITTEIKRIYDISKAGRLEMEDLKCLESLTRAWKNISGTPLPTGEISLGDLSTQELIRLAQGDNINEVKPRELPSGQAPVEEPGGRGAVAPRAVRKPRPQTTPDGDA